jgi:hypothetical protein
MMMMMMIIIIIIFPLTYCVKYIKERTVLLESYILVSEQADN